MEYLKFFTELATRIVNNPLCSANRVYVRGRRLFPTRRYGGSGAVAAARHLFSMSHFDDILCNLARSIAKRQHSFAAIKEQVSRLSSVWIIRFAPVHVVFTEVSATGFRSVKVSTKNQHGKFQTCSVKKVTICIDSLNIFLEFYTIWKFNVCTLPILHLYNLTCLFL